MGLPLAFTPHGASWRTCIAGRGDGRARSRTRKGRDEPKTTKAQQHWRQDPPSEVQNTAGCTPKRAGATAGRTAEPGVGPQQVRRRDEDELRPAVTHGGGAGRPGPPFHRGLGAKPPRAPHGAIITAVPRLAGPWAVGSTWGLGQRSGFPVTKQNDARARRRGPELAGTRGQARASPAELAGHLSKCSWGRRGLLHRAGTPCG